MRQPLDPVQGLHPINGVGVPHADCMCKNCREARHCSILDHETISPRFDDVIPLAALLEIG